MIKLYIINKLEQLRFKTEFINDKKFNFEIWINYIQINWNYSLLERLVRLLLLIHILFNLRSYLKKIRSEKKEINKTNMVLRILDFLFLIIFLWYFQIKGFIFFLLIKYIIFILRFFQLLWYVRSYKLFEQVALVKHFTKERHKAMIDTKVINISSILLLIEEVSKKEKK